MAVIKHFDHNKKIQISTRLWLQTIAPQKNSHKKALRCLIKRNQIEWYRIESSSDRSCSTFRIESMPFVKISLGFSLFYFWSKRISCSSAFPEADIFGKSHAYCSGSGPAINNASSRGAWEATEVTRVRTKHLLI